MDNETAVSEKIAEMENTFDLVMIADRFDESMILLKDLLCWDYRDITNVKLNARRESTKSVLSDEVREALKDYLKADYQLYNHFSKKFDKLVNGFGKGRMEKELGILGHANDNLKRACSLRPTNNDKLTGENKLWGKGMVGYTASTDEQCQMFSISELNFIDHLRDLQDKKARVIAEEEGVVIQEGLMSDPWGEQKLNNNFNVRPLEHLDIEKLKSMYIHKTDDV